MRDLRWMPKRMLPLTLALLLTFFRAFYGGLPQNGDRFNAVPIAIESGWPGTYPAGDILVQSGLNSGFHLYVALGKVAALGISPWLLWEAGMLTTTFLLALLAFKISEHLTERREIATLSTVVLMAMPPFRGSLVWSPIPGPEFVTASVGHCVVLLVMLCSWRRRWMVAGIASGALCLIHPSNGSIAVLLLLSAGLVWWKEDRHRVLRAVAAAAVVAAPNVFAMTRHLLAAPAGGVTEAGLFGQLAPFQAQYSLANFLDAGIGFYTSMLVLAVAGIGTMAISQRRHALVALSAIHGLVFVYILGVEAFHSTFLGIFFWFRATAFAKIIAIPACVLLAVQAWRSPGFVVQRSLLGVLLIVAAFVQNDTVAASFLLLAVATTLSRERALLPRGLAALLGMCALASIVSIGWRRLGIPVAPEELRVFLAVASGVLPMLALPFVVRPAAVAPEPSAGSPRTRWWFAGSAAVLALAVLARHPYDIGAATMLPERWSTVRARILMQEPAGEMAGVERWARGATQRTALFVVPPDGPESVAFRVRSERGVFVTIADLAQLTYAPKAFLEARLRATLAGVRVINGHPDASGYAAIDDFGAEQMRQAGATHIVFRRRATPPLALPVVYADAGWIVYEFENGR